MMVDYNAEDVVKYSEEEVLKSFQENYEGIERVRKIRSGMFNLDFEIETKNTRKFGKAHNPQKLEKHILLENSFCRRMLAAGVPVPETIKTKGGRDYCETSLGFITLHEFLEGEVYSYRKTELVGSARTQTRVHNVDLGELIKETDKEDVIDNPEMLFAKVEDIVNSRIDPERVLERAIKILRHRELPRKMEKTIIHADYHPWNLRFDTKGKVVAVFDFDFVQPGRRIYDLAISLIYFGRSEGNKFVPKTALEQVQQYVAAYSDVISLNGYERFLATLMSLRLLDNLSRDLRNKDGNYEINNSNKRNLSTLKWALTLDPKEFRK